MDPLNEFYQLVRQVNGLNVGDEHDIARLKELEQEFPPATVDYAYRISTLPENEFWETLAPCDCGRPNTWTRHVCGQRLCQDCEDVHVCEVTDD